MKHIQIGESILELTWFYVRKETTLYIYVYIVKTSCVWCLIHMFSSIITPLQSVKTPFQNFSAVQKEQPNLCWDAFLFSIALDLVNLWTTVVTNHFRRHLSIYKLKQWGSLPILTFQAFWLPVEFVEADGKMHLVLSTLRGYCRSRFLKMRVKLFQKKRWCIVRNYGSYFTL